MASWTPHESPQGEAASAILSFVTGGDYWEHFSQDLGGMSTIIFWGPLTQLLGDSSDGVVCCSGKSLVRSEKKS